jgi:hypothetical protein
MISNNIYRANNVTADRAPSSAESDMWSFLQQTNLRQDESIAQLNEEWNCRTRDHPNEASNRNNNNNKNENNNNIRPNRQQYHDIPMMPPHPREDVTMGNNNYYEILGPVPPILKSAQSTTFSLSGWSGSFMTRLEAVPTSIEVNQNQYNHPYMSSLYAATVSAMEDNSTTPIPPQQQQQQRQLDPSASSSVASSSSSKLDSREGQQKEKYHKNNNNDNPTGRPTPHEVARFVDESHFDDGVEHSRNVIIDRTSNRSFIYTTDMQGRMLPEILFLDVPDSPHIARICGQWMADRLAEELQGAIGGIMNIHKRRLEAIKVTQQRIYRSTYEVQNVFIPCANVGSLHPPGPTTKPTQVQSIDLRFCLRLLHPSTKLYNAVRPNFFGNHDCTHGIIVAIPFMENGSAADKFWGSTLPDLPTDKKGNVGNNALDMWCKNMAERQGLFCGKLPEEQNLDIAGTWINLSPLSPTQHATVAHGQFSPIIVTNPTRPKRQNSRTAKKKNKINRSKSGVCKTTMMVQNVKVPAGATITKGLSTPKRATKKTIKRATKKTLKKTSKTIVVRGGVQQHHHQQQPSTAKSFPIVKIAPNESGGDNQQRKGGSIKRPVVAVGSKKSTKKAMALTYTGTTTSPITKKGGTVASKKIVNNNNNNNNSNKAVIVVAKAKTTKSTLKKVTAARPKKDSVKERLEKLKEKFKKGKMVKKSPPALGRLIS